MLNQPGVDVNYAYRRPWRAENVLINACRAILPAQFSWSSFRPLTREVS